MKVALVTDTHFGARSDSLAFDGYFKRFYDDFFFPSLQEQGITPLFTWVMYSIEESSSTTTH